MNPYTPTSSQPRPTHRRHVRVVAAAALIPLFAVLSGCGGSSSGTPAAAATRKAPSQGPGPNPQGRAGSTFPGASGLIAAASPGTLQVQSTTAQNTVVYTAATTFTKVTPGQVAARDCVTVAGRPATSPTQGLTADSVRIVAKVNGTCQTNGAGASGGRGSFPQRPSGAPTGGSGQPGAFATATGTVSSVTGSTILLQGVLRTGRRAAGDATPPAPTTITVTLSASATVTQIVLATSAAAVVGQCASAIGAADSVGTINAKSITISTPGPTGCQARFGGRFNGNSANGTGPASAGGANA